MDAYELHEARFLQESLTQSAANALVVRTNACPAGKVWTFLSASYTPSVGETKVVFFAIQARSANVFPIGVPQSLALTPTSFLPLVTEGMEIKIFPAERLAAYRDSATAGSSMYLLTRFIESDLPYYSYEEPLKKIVRSEQKHGSAYRSTGGISTGGGSTAPSDGERSGGKQGGPQPI